MRLDRGIIKWQPFESLASSNETINKILKEKNKVEKPILFEEQLVSISNSLMDALESDYPIKIKYYKSGNILFEKGKIKLIDTNYKKIILNNKTIYFSQILEIK